MDKKTKSIGFMLSVVLSITLFVVLSIILSSCRQDSIVPGDKPLGKRNVIVPGMDIGKRAVVFGDSISSEEKWSWVPHFSRISGIEIDNRAIAATGYTKGPVRHREAMRNEFLESYDTIFLAGGFNDIYVNSPVSKVEREFRLCCDMASGRNVIVLIPIRIANPSNTDIDSGVSIRNMLYDVALEYGFSIIDLSVLDIKTVDGIHPTPSEGEMIASHVAVELLGL